MKITRLQTYTFWRGTRNALLLKIKTDAGIHGWGEGSMEWMEDVVAAAIHNYRELLIGRNPLDNLSLVDDLTRRFPWKSGPILGSALSAIDIALWDIVGKARGAPVYELLGGARRRKMRAYANYTFLDVDEAVRQAQHWTAQGLTAMKANPAEQRRWPWDLRAIDETVAVLAALREATGPHVDYLLDAHGSPTPLLAVSLAEAIAPYRPMFLEEPTQWGDVGALAEVAQKSPVPIATGEKLMALTEFRELCDARAAAILQPDVCHAYGITGLRRIAELAELYQLWMAPHNANGPVGTAAALHVDAAIHNFLIQEGGGNYREFFSILQEPYPYEVVDGYFELSGRPGLGVEVDEAALAALPPQRMPIRQYRHEDGSWSGW